MALTDMLYRAARASADVRAAEKGPRAVGKRVVRKTVYREEGRVTRRLFRGLGL